jgi:hypothetical protein
MTKRFSAWLIGPFMLSTAAVAVMPAAAAQGAVPHSIAGTYTCFINWNHVGYHKFPLTLNRDHTGTGDGYPVVWSRSGQSFEMVLNGIATYRGTRTKAGFNSKASPGLATTSGASGPWYAIKTG